MKHLLQLCGWEAGEGSGAPAHKIIVHELVNMEQTWHVVFKSKGQRS